MSDQPSGTSPGLGSVTDRALAILEKVMGQRPRREKTHDNLRLYVPVDKLLPALEALKIDGGFEMLAELGCVDYLGYPGRSPDLPRFEVHYILLDLNSGERLIVKAGVSDPDPTLPSVVSLWLGADWMEREVYDMYGIRFEGHPDPRRILMPDEFSAFPLRKDYPLRGRGERHNFPRITREKS